MTEAFRGASDGSFVLAEFRRGGGDFSAIPRYADQL
jgi:hypothetical protein